MAWAYFVYSKTKQTFPVFRDLTSTGLFEFVMCIVLLCGSVLPLVDVGGTRECGTDWETCEAEWYRPAKPYLLNAFRLMVGAA